MEHILSLIEKGLLVLTVNARLMRSLLIDYDAKMTGSGAGSWDTPGIVPLGPWLLSRWEDYAPHRPVLSRVRARALWMRIVKEDPAVKARGILNTPGLADKALEAYSLMKEYGIGLPEDIYLSEESAAFKGWAGAYERELRRLGFTDPIEASLEAVRLIGEGVVDAPAEVVLAGFDELAPMSRRLLDAFVRRGARVLFWPEEPLKEGAPLEFPSPGGKISIRRYPDEETEIIEAALWVRRNLAQGVRIGVIVPDLSRKRAAIEREFSSVLDPASILPEELAEPRKAYNISLGGALLDEPIIKAAIDILSIDEGSLPVEEAFSALSSPYFSMSWEESAVFAGLESRLRKDNRSRTSLAGISRALEGVSPSLKERIDLWIKALRDSGGKSERPGAWAKAFGSLLKTVGFASGVKLTSTEFQAMKAWGGLLDDFSSLDDFTGPMGRGAAASELKRLAAERIHQSETPECQVHVLGLLEAAGLFFDKILLLGCHEYALPSEPDPNPFIPVRLQKEFDLPHSSNYRELRFGQLVVGRILSRTGESVISYPSTVDDRTADISPLFKGIATDNEAGHDNSPSDKARMKDAPAGPLEEIPDGGPIPLTAEELKRIKGGVSILKDQSACPFKAFATHRLGASGLPRVEAGIPAMTRGTIVHEALKNFWDEVRDSRKLKSLSDSGALEGVIKASVKNALGRVVLDPPFSDRFLDLERERLEGLLREWAGVELFRPGFTVRAIEKEETVDLKGLGIRMRIDRIDALDAGGSVLIDYKTGEAKTAYWKPPRPKEPQLPAYTVTGSYDAVAFGSLRPGECRFTGLSRLEGMLPGVKPVTGDDAADDSGSISSAEKGWEGLLASWKRTVEGLAGSFLEGANAVDPNPYLKGSESPCDRCDLTPLCRIKELGAIEPDTDEDPGL